MVFIPPPVDPGEAPTNIKNIIIINVELLKNVMLFDVKPADRATTELKNEAIMLSPSVKCCKLLLYSKM